MFGRGIKIFNWINAVIEYVDEEETLFLPANK
jgi:hypothetical protein